MRARVGPADADPGSDVTGGDRGGRERDELGRHTVGFGLSLQTSVRELADAAAFRLRAPTLSHRGGEQSERENGENCERASSQEDLRTAKRACLPSSPKSAR